MLYHMLVIMGWIYQDLVDLKAGIFAFNKTSWDMNGIWLTQYGLNKILAILILSCPSNSLKINWSFLQMCFWRYYQRSVNIGSGNGLVPSGTKPLSEPMLTPILVPYYWFSLKLNSETKFYSVCIYNKSKIFNICISVCCVTWYTQQCWYGTWLLTCG